MRALRVICLAAIVWSFSAAVVAQAASPIRQLTQSDTTNVRPAWSPDHTKVAFQSNRDGSYHIYVMDADGRNVKQISSGAEIDDRHPAWSPDARYVAVDSGDATRREIWIIEVATQRRTQLTRTDAFASFPSWSPDGTRIAYYVYRGGAMDVWASGRDGSGAVQLSRGLANEQKSQCTFACHSARWSPDGSRIAVSDGALEHVLLISAVGNTGSAPTVITPEGEKNHFPVYLKDGTIVYVSEHLSLDRSWTDLWIVDPARPDQRTELAKGVLAQGPFEFSSDASQLLFSSPRSGNFEIYSVTLDADGKAALATRQNANAAAPPVPQAAPVLPGLSTEAFIFLGIALFAVIAEVGYRVLRRRRKSVGV